MFNIKVTEDKGTTAEGQPQSKAESLCFCTKPAFCTCPGCTCSQGCPIPWAASSGSCSSCAQAAPCVVSQKFPTRDVTRGSDAFGSRRQVLDMQVGLIHSYSVSSEELRKSRAGVPTHSSTWLNPQWVRGTGNNEGSTLCSMALSPFRAWAWGSQHKQVRRSTDCCKQPLYNRPFSFWTIFVLHLSEKLH